MAPVGDAARGDALDVGAPLGRRPNAVSEIASSQVRFSGPREPPDGRRRSRMGRSYHAHRAAVSIGRLAGNALSSASVTLPPFRSERPSALDHLSRAMVERPLAGRELAEARVFRLFDAAIDLNGPVEPERACSRA